MKKFLCLMLICCMALSVFACFGPADPTTTTTKKEEEQNPVKALTWAEFMATENDAEIIIEGYVQGKQSWWDNKCSVYLQQVRQVL